MRFRRLRLLPAIALSGALLAASPWTAGPAEAAPAVARVAGADRFATAAALSSSRFPDGAPVAYVATGRQFPDALAGGPAAAAERAPVLLTERDVLPAPTAGELRRLRPGRVVVLGGLAAVSGEVAAEIGRVTGRTPERRAGADRYATAEAISAAVFAPGTAVVHVATGENFPDALAAGAAAAAAKGPVLLVSRTDVPEATARELRRLGPATIVIAGGAVSGDVERRLRDFAPEVTRVAGPDRYATADAVSARAFPSGAGRVLLATGVDFPDALAGGAAAAVDGGPLLLAPAACLRAGTAAELARLGATSVTVLGGKSVAGMGMERLTACGATADQGLAPCAEVPFTKALHRFYLACTTRGGSLVAGSGRLEPAALLEAARLAEAMTAERPDVRARLWADAIHIGIMAADEVTTDIPEHAHLKDDPQTDWDARARGLGSGGPGTPTTGAEENLLCREADTYRGESILIHEFAHTFFIQGLDHGGRDAGLRARLDQAYRDAMAAGRWRDTYAATNAAEYWAEGVQSWFDANLSADPPNGIHNHVDTRAELQQYDPALAALVDEVMPSSWTYACP